MTGVYGWFSQRRPTMPGDPSEVQATNGVNFHRIAEPLRAVKAAGYTDTAVGSVLDDDVLDQFDTIVASMLHGDRETEAWQKIAANESHRLVLDVDDAMWAPDWSVFREHYTEQRLHNLLCNVTAAHVVTTPSPVIAEFLAAHNRNVWIVPNTVPGWVLDIERGRLGDQPAVGWQGSPSHARDWPMSQRRALARFVREADWRMVFVGPGAVPEGWPDATVALPWQPAGSADYYESLRFDVGVGPLKDTTFNRCKSGLRAVEYAALGIVAVLPDLPMYRPWVEDGVTGRLVRSHQTLRNVLHEVAADPDWRHHMSVNARDRAGLWTTEAQVERWLEAWMSR
jgi:hypothetical protein